MPPAGRPAASGRLLMGRRIRQSRALVPARRFTRPDSILALDVFDQRQRARHRPRIADRAGTSVDRQSGRASIFLPAVVSCSGRPRPYAPRVGWVGPWAPSRRGQLTRANPGPSRVPRLVHCRLAAGAPRRACSTGAGFPGAVVRGRAGASKATAEAFHLNWIRDGSFQGLAARSDEVPVEPGGSLRAAAPAGSEEPRPAHPAGRAPRQDETLRGTKGFFETLSPEMLLELRRSPG